MQGASDPIAVVKASLLTGGETGGALRYLFVAAPQEIKLGALRELVFIASGSNANTPRARDIICSIGDREKLIVLVQPIAEALLSSGDDETYLRIAELYSDLCDELLQKHLALCAAHPDAMVREVPSYFQGY